MQVIKIDIIKSEKTVTEHEIVGQSESSGIPGVNISRKVKTSDGKEWIVKLSKDEHKSRWRYIPHPFQYCRERAAYLVDQQLSFNLVPLTKIIKLKGEIGSKQEWIPDTKSGNPLLNYTQDIIWRMGLLDLIIGNTDRHSNNWLERKDKIWAIDAGYSFPTFAESSDPRSIILSRFAYRIWDKRIPERYLKFLLPLKDADFQNHIRKLVGEEAFNLFKERVDALLKGVAKFPKYRVVEKIKGIPSEKEK